MYICFFQTQIFLIDFEIVARWEKGGEGENERPDRFYISRFMLRFIAGITNKTDELSYAYIWYIT